MERLPDDQVAAIEDGVRAHLTRAAAGLRDLFVASALVRDVHVRNIHLPWRRLFEVGFDVGSSSADRSPLAEAEALRAAAHRI